MVANSRTILSPITGNRSDNTAHIKTPSERCICVVGVGYVGESLLQQFGRTTRTIGYDVSVERIEALSDKYHDYGLISLTTQPQHLKTGTHFLVAVPTPLREDNTVNLTHIHTALNLVFSVAAPGSCIIIESSVPVGTTRSLLGPYQSIYHGGMSPERIDPGRPDPPAEHIPKIVSGLTPAALKQIVATYGLAYKKLVPVSRPEVAEMTKLHENCYRMVNIAYVNEISDACLKHGIDPKEMIEAASTKPFGFQPFLPGLGVGGHCLPVNPWYLFHNNKKLRILELATKVMAERPRTQARRFHRRCRLLECLGSLKRRDPRILVVGVGFKAGQSNLAHSPALSFARTLKDLGCSRVAFYDPSIEADSIPWLEKLNDMFWTKEYVDNKFDGVAWCNHHSAIDATVLDNLQRTVVKSFVW